MSALDELRASLTPPSAPVDRPITVGAIVTWAHAGAWQYGTIQSLDRAGRRAFVRPHDRLRDLWPKPWDELEVILTGDEHRAMITAAHAARIYGS